MNAPDMIWLHPITEDSFQDQWWESGDDGDVPYVPAAALAEAQATIARLEAENARLTDELNGAGEELKAFYRALGAQEKIK